MGTVLGILGSAFSGGATGLIGVLFQRVFDWLHVREQRKADEAKFAHEQAMKRIDIEVVNAEWQGRVKVAEKEGEAKVEAADSAAFAASMFKEPERYSSERAVTPGQNWLLVLLDVLRGGVRPGLTLYLCILVSVLLHEARKLIAKEDLSPADALKILFFLIDAIVYVWTTCTLWWFGTRNRASVAES